MRDFKVASVGYQWCRPRAFMAVLVSTFGALLQLSQADEVYLKNGNRISGVIKQTDKQRVILEVSGLGTMVLDQAEIASVKRTPTEVPEVHPSTTEDAESRVGGIEESTTSATQPL